MTPENLRRAVNVKKTLTTPTAEGAKGTTVALAKGAAKGAATGGLAGAARGAAVAFLQTAAGRRVIAIVLAFCLLALFTLPLALVAGMSMFQAAGNYGDTARSADSAVSSGQEREDVNSAVNIAKRYGIQWPVYLALTVVQPEDEIDAKKLADSLNSGNVRTLGVGGVYTDGKGLTAGATESEKKDAEKEKKHYVSALEHYGLNATDSERVYMIALKWAFGEVDQCTTSGRDSAEEPAPAPTATPTIAPADAPTPAATDAPVLGAQTVKTSDGKKYNLSDIQVGNIQKIIKSAASVPGITTDAIMVALMAAMAESSFKNYANSGVPESLDYPHDAVGSDHDSVGFWQMRQGWGTTAELMDIDYQVKAFFGGPEGPNGGSPRGLFDIEGWETMTKGEAAQKVEVSAHPDRYQAFETLAAALVQQFSSGINFCNGSLTFAGEAGHPLGDSEKYPVTAGYGYTYKSAALAHTMHNGIDFATACDTPIYAVSGGEVVYADYRDDWGWHIVIDHGGGLMTRYAHMPPGAFQVALGDVVPAGQQIGAVGSTGRSTGCHLHLETIMDGKRIDPARVLADMGIKLTFA
ncbi:M23 family metallopeptidase [Microbacterium sp. 77mftsu3.1]|uniref:M23 family metallopeptidase n=1 Tax=Microbacterium sp. 77mftsu3.1 TaxID=1761802 RepID=UPI000364C958|nr:M23 family metallopeptidase [Microbacterium sp. 77mftsu3.1]